MQIGIDARLWYESGVGRYIRNLVTGFEKASDEYNFTVFLNQKAYDNVEFKSKCINKVLADVPWHTLSEQWRMKEIIERQNLDLVHFPYFSYPIFYKRPFVITIHDLIIDHFPTGVASSLPLPLYKFKHYGYKKIISSSVNNAQKIIVPSIATKDEIIEHYKASQERIEVVYEGFDPSISRGKNTKLVSSNYILYVGNAYPHKNLDLLIRAYRQIRNNNKVDLVLIGRKDFFYNRLEVNKTEGVHFLHEVDDFSLFDYYTNAKLLVVPSLMEGFGLPLLEGMSLSCPVVASNTKALKEIGEDACSYFDPKDANDLVKVVGNVLNNTSFQEQLINKGKERVRDFSWKSCIDKTLRIYESCNSIRPRK